MALKAELENALRAWLRYWDEGIKALAEKKAVEVRCNKAEAAMNKLERQLVDCAGVGASVTQRYVRLDDLVFRLDYVCTKQVQVTLLQVDE